MPYDKFTRNGRICIYKVDANKKPTGASLGCHDDESGANRQLAALYAQEGKTMPPENEVENTEKVMPEWFLGESFDEFEQVEALEEKAEKVMKGARLVPSIAENLVMRNRPVSMFEKLGNDFVAYVKKIFGGNDDMMKEKSSFLVVKDKDGQYLWFSRYSNNIKDRDNPPDIISSNSHMRFVKMVDEGEYPLPDLWLWHEPSLVIGKATWVDYDEENGIAMAAGVFYERAYPIAKAIEESNVSWTVSHGMPTESIVRDKERNEVIVEHQTIEISPVPEVKAANVWADFVPILEKEINMPLSNQKRSELKNFLPITDEEIDMIEDRNKTISETAEALQLERKEIDDPETPVEETPAEELPVEEVAETAVELEPEVEEEGKEITPEVEETLTRAELKELFSTFTKELIDTLDQRYASKGVEEEIEEVIEEKGFDLLTAAGLQEEVIGNLKSLSATVSEETKVDGRTKEGKQKPEETPFVQNLISTGDPIIDQVVAGLIAEPVGE